MIDRRTFVKQQALVMGGLSLGVHRWPGGRSPVDPTVAAPIADPALVRTLALRAVEAAKAAGATYADVRITRNLGESNTGGGIFFTSESLAIGVRARVDGCWGFAASPYWDAEEVVRLAREATKQAKGNVRATPRSIEWQPIPVASGSWSTPIEVDPFMIPIEEKQDLVDRWRVAAQNLRLSMGWWEIGFSRQERAVATTEGAYFTQTVYQGGAGFRFYWQEDAPPFRGHGVSASAVPDGVGAGWECVRDAKVIEQFPELIAKIKQSFGQGTKPGDIGRYDVVCDTSTMAGLVASTVGAATELDRAMGYEANASGTSYLSDPLEMLGSYHAASPLVTITANRSQPRGLATIKWDDEGVIPEDFPLIKNGVLVDYQTTREQAGWLAPWYQKQGKPVRSHGCAGAEDALGVTMQLSPNLNLEPGQDDIGFDELVADTKQGIAVMGASIKTDFQARNGYADNVELREIVNGKLGASLTGLGFLFNTTELWRNVIAIGGARSQGFGSLSRRKGQPEQVKRFTVGAVPAKIENVTFIDPRRKA